MIRKLGLIAISLLFAVVLGFEIGLPNANAAAKRVDCSKVMTELNSGKKAKTVAADLKISTSSVYRCKKRELASKSSAKKSTSTATSSTTSQSSSSTGATKK